MDQSVLYDVHDLKVYPMISDDPAATAYGAPIDVPGVSQIELSPSYVNNSLKGDGKTIDDRTVLEFVTAELTYGKLSPEVLAAIDGGDATSNAGGTITRYRRTASSRIPHFGLAGLISEVDALDGAAKLFVYKAKVQDGTLWSGQTDSHGQPSFTVKGIALESESEAIWQTDLEDVGTPLPADAAAFLATLAALA